MQLLHACPTAVPQFVSLSLLSKTTSDGISSDIGEPMMIAAPLATISSSQVLDVVKELHAHLSATLAASGLALNSSQQDRMAIEMYKEDEKQVEMIQIFRPFCAAGLAVHYRFVRGDDALSSSLTSHVLISAKSGTRAGTDQTTLPLLGTLFCVGLSGSASTHCTPLQHSLPQRINDCLAVMANTPAADVASVKTALSIFLLTDDEQRKTNEMVAAPKRLVLPDTEDEQGRGIMSPMAKMSPMGMISPIAGSLNLKRMTKGGNMGDDQGGGINATKEKGIMLSLQPNGADAARDMTEKLSVLSVSESDTCLRKYTASGQERKANLDLTAGGKSRFRRRKGDADADLDGFDYKGPAKEATKKKVIQPISLDTGGTQPPRKDTRANILSAPRSDAGSTRRSSMDGSQTTKRIESAQQRRMSNEGSRRMNTSDHSSGDGFDPFKQRTRPQRRDQRANDDVSHVSESVASNSRTARKKGLGSTFFDDDRSHASDSRNSILSQARLQVNIALNEDLSCSYKLSQLSSCSVEGVIQVQVKTSSRSAGPFFLLIKDPSGHIDSLQENKKYVDDVASENTADYKFAVSVPNGDNYYPIMRYKCIGDVRPVPIRVQTKVKLEGGYCRVALQISSNPNNVSNLTDLTIVMGVPEEIRGETLITQPAGGVWNADKRSVIWCVSELGAGEKFQLQARFEPVGDLAFDSEVEKPRFPVLVRCQCLFAQLSSIELQVRDIPDSFPADVTMKLAKRFRLSHRERS